MARRNHSYLYCCEPNNGCQFKYLYYSYSGSWIPACSLFNHSFFACIFTNINWFANCWAATVDQRNFCFDLSSALRCLLAVGRWTGSSADWTSSSSDAFLSPGCCRANLRHPFPSIVKDQEVVITPTWTQRSPSFIFHPSFIPPSSLMSKVWWCFYFSASCR